MALGKNIKRFREEKGLKQEGLSALTGGVASQVAISVLERRDSKSSRFTAALAQALGVSTEELISGQRKKADSTPNTEAGPAIKGRVPLISWVQAGEWCETVDNFAPSQAEDWLPCPKNFGPHTFALRVRGVSMEPKYQDGDIIFVDPGAYAEHGKNVVVRLDDEKEATFKQLAIEGEHKFLKPLNPDWPGPKLIQINGNATICGVVIGKWVPE